MIKKDKCMVAYEKYILEFAMEVSNSKVLDIGCGNGNYTKIFNINNNEVYGVDINDFRTDQFKNDFKFLQYDGSRLPFNDGYFEVIVSFDVIEHVEDDENFVREIRRVLKKNGKLLIATPNRNRFSNLLYKFIGKPIKYPLTLSDDGILGKLIHIREYTNKELHNLFFRCGFDDIIVDNFWVGLRGEVNLGVNRFFIKSISQYLFLKNNLEKKL
ncbi:MAG TPA: class I SAM-dependent methyltransferase [Candidatus Paceibacterota bacterium]